VDTTRSQELAQLVGILLSLEGRMVRGLGADVKEKQIKAPNSTQNKRNAADLKAATTPSLSPADLGRVNPLSPLGTHMPLVYGTTYTSRYCKLRFSQCARASEPSGHLHGRDRRAVNLGINKTRDSLNAPFRGACKVLLEVRVRD
jgi:hypothetical protein